MNRRKTSDFSTAIRVPSGNCLHKWSISTTAPLETSEHKNQTQIGSLDLLVLLFSHSSLFDEVSFEESLKRYQRHWMSKPYKRVYHSNCAKMWSSLILRWSFHTRLGSPQAVLTQSWMLCSRMSADTIFCYIFLGLLTAAVTTDLVHSFTQYLSSMPHQSHSVLSYLHNSYS